MGADLIGRTGGGLGCRPYVLSHLRNSVACRRSSAFGEISRIRENDEILRFFLTSSGRRHDVRLRCVGYDLESWSARWPVRQCSFPLLQIIHSDFFPRSLFVTWQLGDALH